MLNSVTLSDSDIFCGDSFITTIDRFDFLSIEIKNAKLFINKCFVKEFNNTKDAKEAVKPLINSLKVEEIDFDFED